MTRRLILFLHRRRVSRRGWKNPLNTHGQPVVTGFRSGFSLLELLAVVAILGIIASIAIPRVGSHSRKTKVTACDVQRANIEVQAQLWFRNRGRWPASDLNDLVSHPDYFPDGPPVCPVDETPYRFDAASEQVIAHDHAR